MKLYRVYREFNTLEEAVSFQNNGVVKKLEEPAKNKLIIVVNSFTCEYAGCGSHQMELNVDMDIDDIDQLSKQLDKMK